MAEYISDYTGEQIDAGIRKANSALQAQSLKTINGESLVGSGNIEINSNNIPSFVPNAFDIDLDNNEFTLSLKIADVNTIVSDKPVIILLANEDGEKYYFVTSLIETNPIDDSVVIHYEMNMGSESAIVGFIISSNEGIESTYVSRGGSDGASIKIIDATNSEDWDAEEMEPTVASIQDVLNNNYQVIRVENIEIDENVFYNLSMYSLGQIDAQNAAARYYFRFEEEDDDDEPAIQTFMFYYDEEHQNEPAMHANEYKLGGGSQPSVDVPIYIKSISSYINGTTGNKEFVLYNTDLEDISNAIDNYKEVVLQIFGSDYDDPKYYRISDYSRDGKTYIEAFDISCYLPNFTAIVPYGNFYAEYDRVEDGLNYVAYIMYDGTKRYQPSSIDILNHSISFGDNEAIIWVQKQEEFTVNIDENGGNNWVAFKRVIKDDTQGSEKCVYVSDFIPTNNTSMRYIITFEIVSGNVETSIKTETMGSGGGITVPTFIPTTFEVELPDVDIALSSQDCADIIQNEYPIITISHSDANETISLTFTRNNTFSGIEKGEPYTNLQYDLVVDDDEDAYLVGLSFSDNDMKSWCMKITSSGSGTEVSGTNDGTNWTSLTIGEDTYAIPQGGSGTEEIYPIAVTATPNSTNEVIAGAQNITMADMGSEAPGYTMGTISLDQGVAYTKPYDMMLAEFHAGYQYPLTLITADSSSLVYGIANEQGMPIFDADHPCAIFIQLNNGAFDSAMMISNSEYGPEGTEIATSLRGYFYSDTYFSFNASGIHDTDITTAISAGKIPVAIIDWKYKDYTSWCPIKTFNGDDEYYFEGEYKGSKFTLVCDGSYWNINWLPIYVEDKQLAAEVDYANNKIYFRSLDAMRAMQSGLPMVKLELHDYTALDKTPILDYLELNLASQSDDKSECYYTSTQIKNGVVTTTTIYVASEHTYASGSSIYIEEGGSGGTTVEANPVLTGNEAYLQGIQIGATRYSAEPDLSGKVISILGDSISTYIDWIPNSRGTENDGLNLRHAVYYPTYGSFLSGVEDTWWHRLIFKEFKAKLGVNDSWSGSYIGNNKDTNTATYTTCHAPGNDTGPDTCMAGLTRIKNLGSNGTPDIIYFYGGTNDISSPGTPGESLGTFDNSIDYSTVDLTTSKWTYFVDAFRTAIMRLQHFYPKTKIIVLLPTYCNTYYNRAKLEQWTEQMKEICDYFGVNYIDLRACGITWSNRTITLGDGNVHPNAYGHSLIADYVKRKTLAILENDFRENTVYTVTNNLNTLTNQNRYIKGVSAGATYSAVLTGSDLTIGRVSMGGEDITSTVYDSTSGIITINNVSGNIVISEGESQYVEVENVSLDNSTYSMMIGEDFILTATIYPNNATNKNVTWSCDNNNVTLTPNGLQCNVTGVTDGTSVVTVTTQEGSFTANCTVTIEELHLTSIAVTTQPSTTAYHYGETFSATGMAVTAYYDDGSSETLLPNEYTITPDRPLVSSDDHVTVSYTYNGDTQTDDVSITVADLDSLSITTQPTRTNYVVGETFDPTGMVVTATWTDASTSTVTDYTYSPNTALALADDTITVSYTIGGITRTATQIINVDSSIWYSSNYNANVLDTTCNLSFSGFAYPAGSYDRDGLNINKIRFTLASSGNMTVGKCSSDFRTVTASEVINVTGNSGEVKTINLANTYTLQNGEHFFISANTDTGTFRYTSRNEPETLGNNHFIARVGTADPISSDSLSTKKVCLSIDFGYDSAA